MQKDGNTQEFSFADQICKKAAQYVFIIHRDMWCYYNNFFKDFTKEEGFLVQHIQGLL